MPELREGLIVIRCWSYTRQIFLKKFKENVYSMNDSKVPQLTIFYGDYSPKNKLARK